MAESYASRIIPVPAQRCWELVRDFNSLATWHPLVATSTIEEGKTAAEVGCLRHLTLEDGGVVRERLRVLDDENRSYSYEFIESPFPVRRYLSTIRVLPISDIGQSFVEWYAHYDAEAADEPKLDTTFREGVFEAGLNGLARHLES